jgi:hypothetical protein
MRSRFSGQIAGMGSEEGTRVVIGRWADSPFGSFADVMIERPDGHRVLLAPTTQVATFVAQTYTFDEVRVEPVAVTDQVRPGRWEFTSPSLTLTLEVGARMPLGHLLRLVPAAVSASPAFATAVDPVARVVLRGVRTRGQARAGRREYYGARDMHAVTSVRGVLDGIPLGDLGPVDPPCRFGFSSTPRAPSVTDVVTTIVQVSGS